MTDFGRKLVLAQAGDEQAIEDILLLYDPLFKKYSRRYGVIDEDLKQFIIMRFLIELKNFYI